MDCSEAREEFSSLLDGELAPELRGVLVAHLAECAECLRLLDQFKRVDAAYRHLAPVRAPEDFEQRVRAAAHSRLIRFPRGRLPRVRLVPLLVAAAAVLVIVGGAWLQFGGGAERFSIARRPVPEASSAAPATAAEPAPGTLGGAPDLKTTTPPQPIASHPKGESAPVVSVPLQVTEAMPVDGARESESTSDTIQEAGKDTERYLISKGGAPKTGESAPPQAPSVERVPGIAEQKVDTLQTLGYAGSQQKVAETKPKEVEVVAQARQENAPAPAMAPAPAASAAPAASPEGAPAAPPPAKPPAPALRMEQAKALDKPAASSETAAGRVIGGIATAPGQQPPAEPEVSQRPMLEKESAAANAPAKMPAKPSAEKQKKAATTRTVAKQRFELRDDGVWYQNGYKGEEPQSIPRGSKALQTLVKNNPKVSQYLELGDHVVFRLGKKWYKAAPD